jgi:hypothetical protein
MKIRKRTSRKSQANSNALFLEYFDLWIVGKEVGG